MKTIVVVETFKRRTEFTVPDLLLKALTGKLNDDQEERYEIEEVVGRLFSHHQENMCKPKPPELKEIEYFKDDLLADELLFSREYD